MQEGGKILLLTVNYNIAHYFLAQMIKRNVKTQRDRTEARDRGEEGEGEDKEVTETGDGEGEKGRRRKTERKMDTEEDKAERSDRKGRQWRRVRRKLSQSPRTLRGTDCSSGVEECHTASSLCLTFLITTPRSSSAAKFIQDDHRALRSFPPEPSETSGTT